MSIHILTERLKLIACNQQTLTSAIQGNQALSSHINAIVPQGWSQFGNVALQHALNKLNTATDEQGWWSYLPIHKATNTLIGLCGYKGKPNPDGMVEIGYEIKTEYQNQGLATELALALITHAYTHQAVLYIQAHTLGQINASNRVLIKCGFEKTAEVDGKDLGTLWKWTLHKP